MREKLIELIRKADKEDHESQTQNEHYAFMADFLIANDVVPVVRCKDCKHRIYSDFDGCYVCHHGGFNAINQEHFCSYGERKDNENK